MNTEYRPPHWSQFLGINFRKLALLLVVGAIVAFAGWKGYRYYAAQKRVRLVSAAQGFLEAGDLRSAVLSARQALQEAPGNTAAVKIMAEAADRAASPAAMLWRARLVELEPNRLEHLLDWAATAVRFKQYPVAEQALGMAAEAGKDSARYHELTAVLALARGRLQDAEKSFTTAAKLAPKNEQLQLNLATVRLQSTDTNSVKAARAALQQLAGAGGQRVPAMRSLRADALRNRRYPEAIAFARSIMQSKEATFPDHIAYLTLLDAARDSALRDALRRLREQVAGKPEEASQLVNWMQQHGQGREGWSWIQSLPPKVRNTMPLPITEAECHVHLRQWNELTAWLNKQNWNELEFLRFAFLARAARELGLTDTYRAAWKQALAATQQQAASLFLLTRTAEGWKWTAEAEQIWWIIAMGNTNQRPALTALNRLYTTRKDERMLLRVAARSYNLADTDVVAKNNYALLSVLLRENLSQAFLLAKENFQRYPDNPAIRSTYAFTLYQQGKLREALELFSAIPVANLEQPSFAAYYGIVLAAGGQQELARRYLNLVGKTNALLPSEQRLVEQARASLK